MSHQDTLARRLAALTAEIGRLDAAHAGQLEDIREEIRAEFQDDLNRAQRAAEEWNRTAINEHLRAETLAALVFGPDTPSGKGLADLLQNQLLAAEYAKQLTAERSTHAEQLGVCREELTRLRREPAMTAHYRDHAAALTDAMVEIRQQIAATLRRHRVKP